jgi:pimeloyl-ACP methyl ester carboxylesterase
LRAIERNERASLGVGCLRCYGLPWTERSDVALQLQLSKTIEAKPLDQWKSVATELLGTQTRIVHGERWEHRVIECGTSGEPLILLHGVGGHAETYARNLHNLANNGFHVYAVDALYHGFSSKEPFDADNRTEMQADALADLVRALGHGFAHVEGESMGSVITFEFGMRYPDLAGKLVLNTALPILIDTPPTDWRENPGGGATLQQLSVQTVVSPTFETVRKRMEWLVAEPSRMTDEMVEIRLRLYEFPEIYASMQNVYGINREWKRPTVKYTEADVKAYPREALVFWTEHNPGMASDYAEYFAGLLPSGKLYVMDDASHWPQWEKPEEHDQVLIDFILG